MTDINLNTSPYYDDFNDDKQYQRILFKPGYAVQARELTQIQTILQKQIERFGNHVFKEGAVIAGCDYALNTNVPYIKILDTDADAATVDNTTLESYEGAILVGRTTGLRAVIKKVTTGLETDVHKTFHVQYLSQGTAGTTTSFSASEELELESDSTTTFVVAASGTNPLGTGSLFSLNNGIIYGKGTFIIHLSQTIVLDAFSSTPTKTVGINVVETIVGSDEDTTLLDPAQGTYNYTAPGADRLKVATELVAFSPETTLSDDFTVLFDITLGEVARRYDLTPYGELNKTLARRTYDESGDYTITPFNVTIREHLDTGSNGGLYTAGNGGSADKLAVGISSGKAYVKGYEYQTFSTFYEDINKPTNTRENTQLNVSTSYGNYVIVDEVCGVANLNAGTLVQLRSTAAGAITAGTYSATSPAGSQIGTARVQSIEYHSGSIGAAGCQYRLYLYDIQMSSSSFNNVRGVYLDNGSIDFHADIADASTQLQDTSYPSLLFNTPKPYATTTDLGSGYSNDFVYRKVMTATVGTNGTFSLTLSGNETWAFTSTTTTVKNNEIVVIANQNMNVSSSPRYKAGQIIPITTVSANTGGVTYTSSTQLDFDLTSDTFDASYSATVIVSVRKTNTSPRAKIVRKSRIVNLQLSKGFTGITASTGSQNVTGFTSLTATDAAVGDKLYNGSGTYIGTVQSVDTGTPKIVLEQNAAVNVSAGAITVAHPNYNVTTGLLTAPLSLGLYDVISINKIRSNTSSTAFPTNITDWTTSRLNDFVLNTGQTDTLYDIASITKKSGSTLSLANLRLVIELDYFEHSASSSLGGYFTIDSYPLPVQGVAASASEIEWYQIPRYTSPTGVNRNLRDMIDFRPTVTAVATDSTTVSGATLNPVAYTTSNKVFATGIYTPHAQEEFTTDLRYNLGRKDRVILDSEGDFKVLTGVADITPIAPAQPGNAMTLAFITLPPFPSLSPRVANSITRPDMRVNIETVENRRYTMRDIGTIDSTLQHLKSYTELSFLEQKFLSTSIVNDLGDERPKNGLLVDAFLNHNNGNVADENYNCTIYGGVLQPTLSPQDVQFEVVSTSNVTRKPLDAIIVVEQLTTDVDFEVGETVTSSSAATGVVKHNVLLASSATSGYRWVRLYLENVTGSFAVLNTITGGTSTATGIIPNTSSTTNISTTLLASAHRPDAVSAPSEGNLATLPYTHSVYAETPHASEAINTVNSIIFKYEGHIMFSPTTDNWFDESTLPEGVFTIPTSGDTSWFASITPPPGVGTTASTPGLPQGSGDETPTPYGAGSNVSTRYFIDDTGTLRTDFGNTQL